MQFFRRCATVDQLAGKGKAFSKAGCFAADNQGAGRIENDNVAFGAGDFARKDTADGLCVFLGCPCFDLFQSAAFQAEVFGL